MKDFIISPEFSGDFFLLNIIILELTKKIKDDNIES